MIISRRFLSAALGLTVPLLTGACQKVPLLAPTGSTIVLTASATALPVNGTADLTAQILEQSNNPPHSGTLITFTTTLGGIEPSEARTDINGRVIVKFSAGLANGIATITATSGGASTGTGTGAAKIAIGTAAVGRVSVNASPATVPNTGGSTTITATVFDINGNALSSAPVSFTTTAGSLSTAIATTSASGVATTTLTTSQTSTVTASVGATAPPASGGSGGSGGSTTPAASGQASGSVLVNVSVAPTLLITGPTSPPSAGLPAAFTFAVTLAAGGSSVRDVMVNWGDGQTQDLGAISGSGAVTGSVIVAHVYRLPGTYAITATLTDSFGNVVTVSISVTVNPKPQPVVTIALASSATTPTAGTTTAFTATVTPVASTGTVIQDVTINYGDGTVTDLGPVTGGGGFTLQHVYQTGGTFNVVLTATDSNGSVGTAVTTVFVQAATPLGVTLSASPTIGTVTTIETFTATVTGLGNAVVTSYLWNFGNGDPPATTTTNQTTHAYSHGSGTFTATVTITTSTGGTASNTTVITP